MCAAVNPAIDPSDNPLLIRRNVRASSPSRDGDKNKAFPTSTYTVPEVSKAKSPSSSNNLQSLLSNPMMLMSAALFFTLLGIGIGIGVGSTMFKSAAPLQPPNEDSSALPMRKSSLIMDKSIFPTKEAGLLSDKSTLPANEAAYAVESALVSTDEGPVSTTEKLRMAPRFNGAILATGTPVSVRGIVVWDGRHTSLKGFYLQSPVGTTTPLGSEAVFVFCSTGSLCTSTSFGEGSDVQVNGTVSSIADRDDSIVKPRISQNNVDQSLVFCSTPTIAIVEGGPRYCSRVRVRQIMFPLPEQNADQVMLDSLGSLVEIIGAQDNLMTVVANQNLAKFGELSLSSNGLLYAPTMVAAPGDAAKAVEEENKRKEIILDDANFASNAQPTLYPEGGIADTENATLRVGYTIATSVMKGLVVLDRRFSKWRLQPNNIGRLVIPLSFSANSNKRLTAKEQAEEKGVADTNLQNAVVRLMSMNVENFFVDPVRSGSCPLFQCRGAQNEAHYIIQSRKIYGTIAQVKPAILAIQEMENDPQDIALTQFCSELNTFIRDGTVNYTFVKTGKTGQDAIKTGIVFDSKQVDLVGSFAILDYQGGSRPSVAQTFQAKGSTDKFTVVSNHLKSKLSSGCSDEQDCENDNPFGEGAYATLRAAHAEKLRIWMNSDPTSSGSSKIIAFGDFNANRQERAPQVLVKAGFIDIASRDNVMPYSYQYEGRLGTLDYAFASPSMADVCQKSAEWHANSFEPDVLGYQKLGVAASVFRSSDHDPLFMSCDFEGGVIEVIDSPATTDPTTSTPFIEPPPTPHPSSATPPWKAYVNEFHTDNFAMDVDEFVEIAVSSVIDPSRVKVELINGANGRPYFSASLSTFSKGPGKACAGNATEETLFYFRYIPTIQNGPDSIAVAVDDILVDHVSYPENQEFEVVEGIATGDRPTGVGVPVSHAKGLSVSRIGTSSSSTALTGFQWRSAVKATPGNINNGQNFVCS